MKTRKNLLKILILLILSGSIINAGYIKEKNTKRYHMVLAVWENLHKEPLILDNLSFRVLPLSKRYDLEPEYCLMDGKYFKIKKDGINLEPINIRMQSYENLLRKEKEEKFWKN